MTLQWHINENCNLRCKHCYQDNYQYEGMPLNDLTGILNKMESFALKQAKNQTSGFKAHINITGGEPFLKKELIPLLKEIHKRKIFSFGILSNGYLLHPEELAELKALQPKFIQISLDGNKAMNDSIRGEGSFGAIVHALKTYKALKIPCMISFTANAVNYRTFPEVVSIARKYNAFKVWTDRYIPGFENDSLTMHSEQFKEFLEIILKEQKKANYHFLSKTKVSSNRALQFLITGGQPYKCSAGDQLLAIMANGDVMPCRRLPIIMGNVLKEDLTDIYQHPLTKSIHCSDLTDKDCAHCYYVSTCNGGLKCIAYATYHDYNRKDPDCWI